MSSNPVHCEVSLIHVYKKFDSDLRQISGFLWVLWFPPPILIKLTATIYNWRIVESDVKLHNRNPTRNSHWKYHFWYKYIHYVLWNVTSQQVQLVNILVVKGLLYSLIVEFLEYAIYKKKHWFPVNRNTNLRRGRHDRDHMVVEFTTTCNQYQLPLMLWVWISIRARYTTYVIKFVSDLC